MYQFFDGFVLFFTTMQTLAKELVESGIRSDAWNKLGFFVMELFTSGSNAQTKSSLKPPSLRTGLSRGRWRKFTGRRRPTIIPTTGD